jgi:hypothetical protein
MTHDNAEPQTDDRNGVADATPATETVAPPGDISAREAVRRAVAELGADAELDDVIAHLQSKYNLCPPRGTVQSYLSLARKEARDGTAEPRRRRGRPRRTAAINGQTLTPTPSIDDAIDAWKSCTTWPTASATTTCTASSTCCKPPRNPKRTP